MPRRYASEPSPIGRKERHMAERRVLKLCLVLLLIAAIVCSAVPTVGSTTVGSTTVSSTDNDEAPTDPTVDGSTENVIVENGGFFTDNVTVANRLDVIFSEFPVGSYFSYTGEPCTCHGKCSYYGGCECISDYEDPEKGGQLVRLYSIQCMGFAHYSFYKIFGFVASASYASNPFYSLGSLKSSQMTVSNVKKLFANAKTGADIRIKDKHSVVLLKQDDEGLYILQANWVSPCMVNVKYWTWEEFTSRYAPYGIEYIYMPEEYPVSVGEYVPPVAPPTPIAPTYALGKYEVTASNSGLRLRAGPGTDYDRLDLLPDATVVEVTEVVDGWGKVVYNGKTGWISLQYTRYVEVDLPALRVTVSEDRTYAYAGTEPDFSGITVTKILEDQSSLILTPEHYTLTYSAPEPGNYTATIEADGLTVYFDVIVLPYGDINADGAVTVADAMLIQRGGLTERQTEGADTNSDGLITVADAETILKYLTGRVDALPVKEG